VFVFPFPRRHKLISPLPMDLDWRRFAGSTNTKSDRKTLKLFKDIKHEKSYEGKL
jgi:hypothetical protein